MSARYELRPARPEDDDFLFDLYGTTRADEVAASGWGEAEIESFLRMQWEAQRADYGRRYPGADHLLVVVEGAPAGRIWIDRGDDEIRLLDIALLPTCRGMGIGTHLLRGLQEEARLTRRRLGHAVVKDNAEAVRLYTSLGFRVLPVEHPTHWFMEWAAPAAQG